VCDAICFNVCWCCVVITNGFQWPRWPYSPLSHLPEALVSRTGLRKRPDGWASESAQVLGLPPGQQD
jgi:hypothetical protein